MKPLRICMLGLLSDPLVRPLIEMVQTVEPEFQFGGFGDWVLLPDGMVPPIDGPSFRPPSIVDVLRRKKRGTQQSNSSTSTKDHSPGSPSPNWAKATAARWITKVEPWLDQTIRRRQYETFFARFDVIHLQSLFVQRHLKMLANLTNIPPVVSTLWGSDVLRCSDMNLCRLHQTVLHRSDLITASGIEFREVALSKYGRDLAPKFRETYVSPNYEVMQRIANAPYNEAREWLGTMAQELNDERVLCIGHNGDPGNQHIAVLRELSKLATEVKRKLFLLCPMTYGGNNAYRNEVEMAMKEAGMRGKVLRKYLPESKMHLLRKACDLFVFVPVSDAFSASVTQALTANCVTVVGSWLPYARRRRSGFVYHEIDTIADLPRLTTDILGDFPKYREAGKGNESLSLQFFDPTRLGKQWADVYRDAARC